MNRLTRRLANRAQRAGLVAPRRSAGYFAPPQLIEDAKRHASTLGLSDTMAVACVRIAQVRAERDRRPLVLDDVVVLLEERAR